MTIDTMNHDEAVSSHAVERYILGELSSNEREAFEGHYFDCSDCFEQIRLGGEFLARTREVLDPEPEKSWLAAALGDLRRPAPVFASALLFCAVGICAYQQSVIGGARRPRIEASYFLTDARSASNHVEVSRKARLSLRVPFHKGEFASYQAQIVTEAGKVRYTIPIPDQHAGDSITIGLRADELDAGRYSVVIQGLSKDGAASEVGSRSFELAFVD